MGIFSIGFGACLGFYFRNTRFGTHLGQKLALTIQSLKNTSPCDYKLALIVRDDLNMSKGKIASQCSHGSVLAYRNLLYSNNKVLDLWEAVGQPKIILKINNEQKLLDLSQNAKKFKLPVSIVCDSGRTEVTSGTKTVIAIGPGPSQVIDKVTGHLKLL